MKPKARRKRKKDICTNCPLYGADHVRSWYVPTEYYPLDDGTVRLLIGGEAPGKQEDLKNRPFIGPSGKFLRKSFKRVMELSGSGPTMRGIGIGNLVRCRPIDPRKKRDRPPTDKERKKCSKYLIGDIKALKPRVVLLLGNSSVQHFFPYERGITACRGRTKKKNGVTFIFAYHPAYLLRDHITGDEGIEDAPHKLIEWFKDLHLAFKIAGLVEDKPLQLRSGPRVEVNAPQGKGVLIDSVDKLKKVHREIRALPKGSVCFIDTEANNLNRVYDNRMLSMQYSWDGERGFVLPVRHPKSPFTPGELETIERMHQDLFTRKTDERIFWGFHNAKYDLHQIRREWDCEVLSSPVVDTMQVAYLLNENRVFSRDPDCYYDGIKGLALDTLAEVYLGHKYYDRADKADRHNIVRWEWSRFVDYAAKDTWMPWHVLQREMEQAEDQGYRHILLRLILYLYSPANLLVVEMEQNGFAVDIDHLRWLKGRHSPLIAEKKRLEGLMRKSRACKAVNGKLVKMQARGNRFLFDRKPWALNPAKDSHRRKLFLDYLELEPVNWTDNDQPSIDSDFYEEYGIWDEDSGEPLNEAALFSDWVGVDKMLSSFIKNFYELVDPDTGDPDMCPDGRVRTHANLSRTTSGRPAFSRPAMQQIPRATNIWRKHVKNAFVAEEGHVLVMADLSANEVRWGAINAQAENLGTLFHAGLEARKEFREAAGSLHKKDYKIYRKIISLEGEAQFNDEGDPLNKEAKQYFRLTQANKRIRRLMKLREAAELKGDIHKASASMFYDMPIEEVTKGIRQDTKSIVFGYMAARGYNAIARQIGKTKEETIQLCREFDRKFPGLKKYLDQCAKDAEYQGYVQGPQGRRRRFSDAIWDDEEWIHAKARRQARNNSIQGAASDACLVAAFRLLDYIREHDKEWRILNIVHDAIYVEVPIAEMREASRAVELCLTEWTMDWMSDKFGINFIAPLEADIELGLSWGDYMGWEGTEAHMDIIEKFIQKKHKDRWGHYAQVEAA